jgi:type II secretory pathway pseudopilin PulG
MITRRTNRRAMAMLAAVAMVGIAAAAVVALGASLTADARRTRLAAHDAQVRQLLLAGVASVADHAAGWKEAPDAAGWDVASPQPLGDQGKVKVTNATQDGRTVYRVEATFDGRHGSTDLHLERKNSHWQITSAELVPN